MNEFIIIFRETLEASLIVGIIYVFLSKQNNHEAIKKLWYGVFAAIIASVFAGFIAFNSFQTLGNTSTKALFEAVFMFITAGLIWYVIFWLSKNVSSKAALENQTSVATKSTWGIFFVVFFAILREGFETAMFLMGSFSMTKNFSYIGFFSGMIIAIFIGYGIFFHGRQINIRSFFKTTTLLLVFLASGMVAYGSHEIESYLVKSKQLNLISIDSVSEIARPWNILIPKTELSSSNNKFFYSYNINGKEKYTHLLHENGRVGVFLKGFFGYNSNPNYIELILWLLSLGIGLSYWRKVYQDVR